MRVIFAVFVLVSLFALKSESKDFCQTFRDNDNRIDYSMVYVYNDQGQEGSNKELLLVIGHDYWRTYANISSDSLHFFSNESRSHNLFGIRYSGTFYFIGHNNSGSVYLMIGFITLSGLGIQLMQLDYNFDPWNITALGASYEQLKLPRGFKTSATFDLIDFDSNVKYITFIDQKPESDNSDLFTRRYVTKYISKATINSDLILSEDVFYENTTRGMKDKIIGTMGQWALKDGRSFTHIIVYSRNNIIEYCYRVWSLSEGNGSQSKIEMIANALNETCSTDRKILIDCSHSSVNYIPIVVAIIILFLCLVLIFVLYIVWSKLTAVRRFVPIVSVTRTPRSLSSTESSDEKLDTNTGETSKSKSSKVKQKK